MRRLKYNLVVSRRENFRLLPTPFNIFLSIYARSMLLHTLPCLYINSNKLSINVYFVYIIIICFHCERDEKRQCTFQCNLNGLIENLYVSRSYMLISKLEYLFHYLLLTVSICNNGNSSLEKGTSITHLRIGYMIYSNM